MYKIGTAIILDFLNKITKYRHSVKEKKTLLLQDQNTFSEIFWQKLLLFLLTNLYICGHKDSATRRIKNDTPGVCNCNHYWCEAK